jgi:nicotinamide-nucleotide amidase
VSDSVSSSGGPASASTDELAATAFRLLAQRAETVATAESLTAGLLGAALTVVAGSSATFRGGLIVYATDLKATLAGVPGDLLQRCGPVSEPVAAALSIGVRDRLDATWGISLTGVAGPDEQDGQPVGTVFVGIAGPGGSGEAVPARTVPLRLAGDRAAIRGAAVDAALRVLCDSLAAAE